MKFFCLLDPGSGRVAHVIDCLLGVGVKCNGLLTKANFCFQFIVICEARSFNKWSLHLNLVQLIVIRLLSSKILWTSSFIKFNEICPPREQLDPVPAPWPHLYNLLASIQTSSRMLSSVALRPGCICQLSCPPMIQLLRISWTLYANWVACVKRRRLFGDICAQRLRPSLPPTFLSTRPRSYVNFMQIRLLKICLNSVCLCQ